MASVNWVHLLVALLQANLWGGGDSPPSVPLAAALVGAVPPPALAPGFASAQVGLTVAVIKCVDGDKC